MEIQKRCAEVSVNHKMFAPIWGIHSSTTRLHDLRKCFFCDDADKQTDGHGDAMLDPVQRVESVRIKTCSFINTSSQYKIQKNICIWQNFLIHTVSESRGWNKSLMDTPIDGQRDKIVSMINYWVSLSEARRAKF